VLVHGNPPWTPTVSVFPENFSECRAADLSIRYQNFSVKGFGKFPESSLKVWGMDSKIVSMKAAIMNTAVDNIFPARWKIKMISIREGVLFF
jgi:hypothetical protein